MKSFLILLFLFQHIAFPQLAQSYFPSQPGFKWTYKATPLDSLNNPIPSLSFYQVDSFAVVQNYQGRSANYILSKSGSQLTIPFTPYLDTSYLSFLNNGSCSTMDRDRGMGLVQCTRLDNGSQFCALDGIQSTRNVAARLLERICD